MLVMTTRERAHQLVDQLNEDDLQEALDYLEGLAREEEMLTEEELARVLEGEAQIGRGEAVPWEEVRRRAGL
jgi:hypothetical protein